MRYLIFGLVFLIFACAKESAVAPIHHFTKVIIKPIVEDSMSIRAVSVKDNEVMYAGSNGKYGYFELNTSLKKNEKGVIPVFSKQDDRGEVTYDGRKIAFRSIAQTKDFFFVLSIENPALLYRIQKKTREVNLVYKEHHETVFYDAMTFWNDKEGIAMGDPTDGCLSIIITRDGGAHWKKIACKNLPEMIIGEAAFAASDTNIKTIGNHTWIVTGGVASRVFYSADKGITWTVTDIPILQGEATQGGYTMDFYDATRGIIYGGDYTKPDNNKANIVGTSDGGKTWNSIGSGTNQGYKSCVQYVPGSDGKELIALGFTGISYSKDSGHTWEKISDESLLSFRFLNDTIAYGGGRNRLVQLTFR